MEQPKSWTRSPDAHRFNWVVLRKFETLAFAFLFLAAPFCAYKVLETANATLAVKNTAVDLVKDLFKWKKIARKERVLIRISSQPGHKGDPFAYIIYRNDRPVEEAILPKGVSIIGSVTFQPGGGTLSNASFIINEGARIAHVEIDIQGVITAP